MTVNFYMAYWGIIKEAVVLEIQHIFQSRSIKEAYNHTFISLIPKNHNDVKVD